ncbi:hypothetical protein Tco_0917649 [Tanacetum coccineum]
MSTESIEADQSWTRTSHMIKLTSKKDALWLTLVESYNTDKDIFDSYVEVFSLKRSRDEEKDRVPSAGSDHGKKRRKLSKDAESSRDSRLKEKKSSSTSKDAS